MDTRLVTHTKLTESGCLEWDRAIFHSGYGQLTVNYKTTLAHRYAWLLLKGEIPEGMHVCHKCDNRRCCNVEHLFLGTHSDNMQDKVRKGRSTDIKGELNPMSKLKEDDVQLIRLLRASGNSCQKIGELYDMSYRSVWRICKGQRWKHV